MKEIDKKGFLVAESLLTLFFQSRNRFLIL